MAAAPPPLLFHALPLNLGVIQHHAPMTILDLSSVWEWCRDNGVPLLEGQTSQAPTLAADPRLPHETRHVYEAANPTARAGLIAAQLLECLGGFDQVLLWVMGSDIWENGEDWPAFYAWRGRHGEKRSLAAAPGHLFLEAEREEARWLLEHMVLCGWDAAVLCIAQDAMPRRRAWLSHDGWFAIQSDKPLAPSERAV